MKKIMFSDKFGLTRAVLNGTKTPTRRVVPESVILEYTQYEDFTIIDAAKYDVGEIVAVAQAYNDFYDDTCNLLLFPSGAGWTNKMFVKSELMPRQIRITDVRIERLQDISDEDCIKEGIVNDPPPGIDASCFCYTKNGFYYGNYDTPREAYAALIDKVSGKGTWERNPYVFVYEFELVKVII